TRCYRDWSSDVCSSDLTNQAYLSITLHWIDKQWCMQHILLDIIPIHENHTGLALAEKFLSTLKDYNIEHKILAVTMDNAANMVRSEERRVGKEGERRES